MTYNERLCESGRDHAPAPLKIQNSTWISFGCMHACMEGRKELGFGAYDISLMRRQAGEVKTTVFAINVQQI